MSDARTLTDTIADLEARINAPETIEVTGNTRPMMLEARAAMIGQLNDLNDSYVPEQGQEQLNNLDQAKVFRDASHAAMVTAGGVTGPALFGNSDRSMEHALERDGEVVTDEHLQTLEALYGRDSARNVAEATNYLQRIETIKAETMDGFRNFDPAANPRGQLPGEDSTDYSHQGHR